MATLDETLEQTAKEPKQTATPTGISTTNRASKDILAARNGLAAKAAMSQPLAGISNRKMAPPGAI